MKLSKSTKQFLATKFCLIIQHTEIPKKILSELIDRYYYDNTRRDWTSNYEGWTFNPIFINTENGLGWLYITNPEGKSFPIRFVAEQKYTDDFIDLT